MYVSIDVNEPFGVPLGTFTNMRGLSRDLVAIYYIFYYLAPSLVNLVNIVFGTFYDSVITHYTHNR